MQLTSSAFIDAEEIPVRYTGEGEDISPPLEWSEIPERCRSFAIICEDPDAPKSASLGHPFVHWLIYNIPANITALPAGIATQERVDIPVHADQGVSSFGKIGYSGPFPPKGHGFHRYAFRLYALDTDFAVPPGAERNTLLSAIEGHILETAELMGKFERNPRHTAA